MIDYRTLLKNFMIALMKSKNSSHVPNALPFLSMGDSLELSKILLEITQELPKE